MVLDFFIKNAQIVDGTGAQPYFGSIGIQGDTILYLPTLKNTAERRRSGFWMPTGRRLCRGSLISIAIPTR